MQNPKINTRRMLITMLAWLVFVFAIYLKVLPVSEGPHPGGMATQVKIWANPYDLLETKLKVVPALVLVVLFSINFTPFFFRCKKALDAPGSFVCALQDVFLSRQHWFRPPPLS